MSQDDDDDGLLVFFFSFRLLLFKFRLCERIGLLSWDWNVVVAALVLVCYGLIILFPKSVLSFPLLALNGFFSLRKRAFHHLKEISIDILLISHLNRIIRLLSCFPQPRRSLKSMLIQFQSRRCWHSVSGSLRFALKWFSSVSAWNIPTALETRRGERGDHLDRRIPGTVDHCRNSASCICRGVTLRHAMSSSNRRQLEKYVFELVMKGNTNRMSYECY